jgi:hypothetical protein
LDEHLRFPAFHPKVAKMANSLPRPLLGATPAVRCLPRLTRQ